jgi:hypothetical protein
VWFAVSREAMSKQDRSWNTSAGGWRTLAKSRRSLRPHVTVAFSEAEGSGRGSWSTFFDIDVVEEKEQFGQHGFAKATGKMTNRVTSHSISDPLMEKINRDWIMVWSP